MPVLSHTIVTKILGLCKQGAMAALKLGQQKQRASETPQLTVAQEARIQRMICEKRPDQLN